MGQQLLLDSTMPLIVGKLSSFGTVNLARKQIEVTVAGLQPLLESLPPRHQLDHS